MSDFPGLRRVAGRIFGRISVGTRECQKRLMTFSGSPALDDVEFRGNKSIRNGPLRTIRSVHVRRGEYHLDDEIPRKLHRGILKDRLLA